LIKLSDSLPLVLVNRVPFARIKHSVDRPASDRVHEVSLVSERMRVPTLKQHCFLLCCFVDRVVHEYLARHVCKRAVKSTCDQDAAITESNGHSIALQKKVVWHKLLRPQILGEVILQDELRVVWVAEEVGLGDGFDFVVEELEGVFVRELHHVVFHGPDVFEQLTRKLRMKWNVGVLELVEGRVIVLVDGSELLLKSFEFVVILGIILNRKA